MSYGCNSRKYLRYKRNNNNFKDMNNMSDSCNPLPKKNYLKN